MNLNCSFHHAQAKLLDSQYVANVYTVMVQGIDYIWRYGAVDIQITAPVGSNHKRVY